MKINAWTDRYTNKTEIDVEKFSSVIDRPFKMGHADILDHWDKLYGKRYDTHCGGKIGTGRKIHRLSVSGYLDNGVFRVVSASCGCGSQRWTSGGFSGLQIIPNVDPELVNCKKCRPSLRK